jgi:hypothetical protein
MSKTILQLDHKDAKEFFLREESYTSVNFPSYIKFSPLTNSAIEFQIVGNHGDFF